MEGGTTFHFVDAGIDAALEQAFSAAGTTTSDSAAERRPCSSTCGPVSSTTCTLSRSPPQRSLRASARC
jgi:hypothetical protein